mmetsp:Transcript_65258/g.182105  ORF Transcript_65258/g.182105 Transcript_65258/m.182105 type:complete len:268 (-) Transcript_65258:151-954(-)
MVERDGRLSQSVRLHREGVKPAVPPAERAALLHLPLQLHAPPHLEALEAPEHAVGVAAQVAAVGVLERLRRRGGLGLRVAALGRGAASQPAAHAPRAEAEPVLLVRGDGLGRDLAGAQVPCQVCAERRLVLQPSWHGGHREPELLLPLEHLERALQPAAQGLDVDAAPVLGALEVEALVERGPPPPVDVAPQRVRHRPDLGAHEAGRHRAQGGEVPGRLRQEAGYLEEEGLDAVHDAGEAAGLTGVVPRAGPRPCSRHVDGALQGAA